MEGPKEEDGCLMEPSRREARRVGKNGTIGSQRPIREVFNNAYLSYMEKSGDDFQLLSDSTIRGAFKRVRLVLYGSRKFGMELPKGKFPYKDLKYEHAGTLATLRNNLEKRIPDLKLAHNQWAADAIIQEVLRRDKIYGKKKSKMPSDSCGGEREQGNMSPQQCDDDHRHILRTEPVPGDSHGDRVQRSTEFEQGTDSDDIHHEDASRSRVHDGERVKAGRGTSRDRHFDEDSHLKVHHPTANTKGKNARRVHNRLPGLILGCRENGDLGQGFFEDGGDNLQDVQPSVRVRNKRKRNNKGNAPLATTSFKRPRRHTKK